MYSNALFRIYFYFFTLLRKNNNKLLLQKMRRLLDKSVLFIQTLESNVKKRILVQVFLLLKQRLQKKVTIYFLGGILLLNVYHLEAYKCTNLSTMSVQKSELRCLNGTIIHRIEWLLRCMNHTSDYELIIHHWRALEPALRCMITQMYG